MNTRTHTPPRPKRSLFYGRHFAWIARRVTHVMLKAHVPEIAQAFVISELIHELADTNANFDAGRFMQLVRETGKSYIETHE